MWKRLSCGVTDQVPIVLSSLNILFYLLDWRHVFEFTGLARGAVISSLLEDLLEIFVCLLVHWVPLIVQSEWRRSNRYFTRNHVHFIVWTFFWRAQFTHLIFENGHGLLMGWDFFSSSYWKVSLVKLTCKYWLDSVQISLDTWIIFQHSFLTRVIWVWRLHSLKFWHSRSPRFGSILVKGWY